MKHTFLHGEDPSNWMTFDDTNIKPEEFARLVEEGKARVGKGGIYVIHEGEIHITRIDTGSHVHVN